MPLGLILGLGRTWRRKRTSSLDILSSKRGPRDYYKGKNCKPTGFHTRKGSHQSVISMKIFFFYVAFVFFFCIYNCKINGLLICNQNLFGCHIKPKDRVFFEILEFLRSEMGFLVLTNLIDCLTLFIKVLILRLPKIENMTFSLREGRYFAFYVRQVHSLYVQEQRNAIL